MTADEQKGLKLRFAAAWAAEPSGEATKAALSIPGLETGIAMQLAFLWVNDPDVLAEKHRLLTSAETAADFLPSKEMQLKDIYAMAQSDRLSAFDRIKCHELYAKIRGFIEKPAPPTPSVIMGHNVMVIENHGTDNDWESKAKTYQKSLISGEPSSVN